MKLTIASYVLSAMLGFFLSLAGVLVDNWHFWAILGTVVAMQVICSVQEFGKGWGRGYEIGRRK